MRSFHALALLALLPLAACSGRDDPASGDGSTPPANTALGRKIQQAMAEASEKLDRENIQIGKNSGLTRAEITPQGDLLIGGKAVAIDEAQRKLLLAYRADMVEVARAGIEVGMRGADLGIEAAAGALKSLLDGSSEEFKREMKARGERIKADAKRVCEHLPDLLASQEALAASLPAFKPYATLDQGDIDDCGKDGNYDVDLDFDAVDPDDSTDEPEHMDAAAEADAAAKGFSASSSGKALGERFKDRPTYAADGVTFVFPAGKLSVSMNSAESSVGADGVSLSRKQENVVSANAGGASIVIKDGKLEVNGKSMKMPASGRTVVIEPDGKIEVI